MNSTQAKQISLEKLLQNLGCQPTKTQGNDLWYLSPFRVEKNASFKINRIKNVWYDFGEQVGGNVIDFISKKFHLTFKESLAYLNKFDAFFSFQKQTFEFQKIIKESKTNINDIKIISHPALIQYLNSRGIKKFRLTYLKEIHYTLKDREYFALGFLNNSQGYEVRSKFQKICLGKKDITTILNQSKKLMVFEGFFDYLSFIQDKYKNEKCDYLILNSVALLNKNLSVLENYEEIELYLDNDYSGVKQTNFVLENFKNATDCSRVFKGFKDYNEWFTNKSIESLSHIVE